MNNICKDITCEKLNNCPYENEEILYCPGYLNTTKTESAWDMFRRLWEKYGEKFYNKIRILTGWYEETAINDEFYILEFINMQTGQDAIKIMQGIEKGLKNEYSM